MTCRVARWTKELHSLCQVSCSRCGRSNLAVFYTSRTLGHHLCSACYQTRGKRRSEKDPTTE